MKELYIISVIFGNTDNVAYCGLSSTISGISRVLEKAFPKPTDMNMVACTPSRVLWKWENHCFICVDIMRRATIPNTCYVITKRNDGKLTESIHAVFGSEEDAESFIERCVDEPVRTVRDKCDITEIDGYKPFSKIIGDENPELNRVHYTIYKSDVER